MLASQRAKLVAVENVLLVTHAEEKPDRAERDACAAAARSMLRIGVTPVPVAIMSAGDSLAGPDRVKKPCGPTNRRTAPGCSACRRVDPGTALHVGHGDLEPRRSVGRRRDRIRPLHRRVRPSRRGASRPWAGAEDRAHPLPGHERHRLPVHTLEHELANARSERSRPREAGFEGRGQVGHHALSRPFRRAPHWASALPKVEPTGPPRGRRRSPSRARARAAFAPCEGARRACRASRRGSRAPPSRRRGWPPSRDADERRRPAEARRPAARRYPTTLASRSWPVPASSSARDASSSAVTTISAPLQTSTRVSLRRAHARRRACRAGARRAGRGPDERARAVRATRGPPRAARPRPPARTGLASRRRTRTPGCAPRTTGPPERRPPFAPRTAARISRTRRPRSLSWAAPPSWMIRAAASSTPIRRALVYSVGIGRAWKTGFSSRRSRSTSGSSKGPPNSRTAS